MKLRIFLLQALLAACSIAVAQTPAFEVATVKAAPSDADPMTGQWSFPGVGQFKASHVTLALLIQLAYNVDASQIGNQPAWLGSNLYDISAKPEEGVKLSREELRPRLQELLKQRFHLAVHPETRSVRGYALVVAKGGPHLTPTTGTRFAGWKSNVSPGSMRGINWTMAILAQYLTPPAGFPVMDQTGLNGSYDIDFGYEKDPNNTESTLRPLPEALKSATGLMLKPQMVAVMTIVIDAVDKVPTQN